MKLEYFRSQRQNLTENDFCKIESAVEHVLNYLETKNLAPIEKIEVLQNCEDFVRGITWWSSETSD